MLGSSVQVDDTRMSLHQHRETANLARLRSVSSSRYGITAVRLQKCGYNTIADGLPDSPAACNG
jgi:hypothetical protein